MTSLRTRRDSDVAQGKFVLPLPRQLDMWPKSFPRSYYIANTVSVVIISFLEGRLKKVY